MSSEITLLTLLPHPPIHDDVIKWKRFPRYWPFVRGIHRSPVNSPHKGQWRGALMFSLIWINGWINNREAGDLRRYRAHYDVTVMNQWVKRRREDTVRGTDDLSPATNSTKGRTSAAWSGGLDSHRMPWEITIYSRRPRYYGHISNMTFCINCTSINHCHAKIIFGKCKTHFSYFLSFFNTEVTQVVHILHCWRQWPVYSAYSISWLLMACRRRLAATVLTKLYRYILILAAYG